MDAAERRRLGHQLAGVEHGLGALGALQREADEAAVLAHLAGRHRIVGGVVDREHVVALAQRARHRSAPAEDRSSRSASVASERCASQASKAPGIAPDCERQRRSASSVAPSRVETAPSSTSECPQSVLVALITDRSAPSASGCCPSGVASVLSTASSAPAACAASATAARSHTVSRGFAGVSTHTSRAPGAAARISSVSVETKRTSIPNGSSRSVATSRMPG